MLRAYFKMRGKRAPFPSGPAQYESATRSALGPFVALLLLLLFQRPAFAADTILVFGDSLSAAYGLSQDAGWTTLLQARLKQKRLDYSVANASISGETSSGGAARIDKALTQYRPAVVIVALGANDGLRGLPVEQMRANLARIVKASKQAGSRVLLVGMRMPPNYGDAYTQNFFDTYGFLAKEYRVALVPFLLEGIAERREMFLNDNIHPTAAAQPVVLDNIWNKLLPLLKKAKQT